MNVTYKRTLVLKSPVVGSIGRGVANYDDSIQTLNSGKVKLSVIMPRTNEPMSRHDFSWIAGGTDLSADFLRPAHLLEVFRHGFCAGADVQFFIDVPDVCMHRGVTDF
jgi:hypothetical protein